MKNLSILQWNIWYLEDIHNVAEFLSKNVADVICLQELTINFDKQQNVHTPNFIAKQLSYHVYFQEITFAGKEIKLANAIFSKYPIINSRTVWINQEQGSGNYDDENRAYIEATLDVGGEELKVGTVHMSYTHKFEPSERKLTETKKLIEAIAPNTERFILTGDLNAEPESQVVNSVGRVLKNCGPGYSENTWTTKPFSYKGFDANTLDWRLDYIFATDDIKISKAQVLATDYSDHLPILVEIEV
jgi:endonuclease/exonuclease/phosphatase family metal-dependent hydrolase